MRIVSGLSGRSGAAGTRGLRGLAALAAGLAVAALAATGCAATGEGSVANKKTLVIGVKPDQPGLGVKRSEGRYEGFDVDVATYVAGKLGVPKDKITFRDAPSSKREALLKGGDVDLVVASYSITAKRKTEVNFSGPYYIAHQDTLVSAREATVRNVQGLRNKKLCKVEGSNSWKRVTEEKKIPAQLVGTDSYGACVEQLKTGMVDAVSTDDLILAGFAAQQKNAFRIVNAPFTDEKYGIGIKKGDLDGCEAVNKAISEMYLDGTAIKLLQKWFGASGLKLTNSVPQFEGCF